MKERKVAVSFRFMVSETKWMGDTIKLDNVGRRSYLE